MGLGRAGLLTGAEVDELLRGLAVLEEDVREGRIDWDPELEDVHLNIEKRLTALRNRVPNIVLLALYGVTTVAGAFSGYAGGLGARASRLPVYVMIVLVCAVILLIQDLDRPSTGFITTSQQPMIDTAAAIAAY